VAERTEVAQRVLHAAVVVEDDLTDGGDPGQGIPDRHDGHLLGNRLPATAGRADGEHDEAVDAMVHEAPGQLQLALRLAVGVRDQRAAVRVVQLALDGAHQLLVPEVGQAAQQQSDDGGRSAAQRPGDRVGLVPQLGRGRADAFLGLGRNMHAAQRIAHRGRRQPGLLGQLPDRRATLLPLRHLAPGYSTGRIAAQTRRKGACTSWPPGA
jgi:hypothetical protein